MHYSGLYTRAPPFPFSAALKFLNPPPPPSLPPSLPLDPNSIFYFISYPSQAPEVLENLKTKKIILIHGEGFGAWCWYKTISLLEESGLLPTALDLTGSGIDLTDTNSVATLAGYSKPLIDYLQDLSEDEKVRGCIFLCHNLFLVALCWLVFCQMSLSM